MEHILKKNSLLLNPMKERLEEIRVLRTIRIKPTDNPKGKIKY